MKNLSILCQLHVGYYSCVTYNLIVVTLLIFNMQIDEVQFRQN